MRSAARLTGSLAGLAAVAHGVALHSGGVHPTPATCEGEGRKKKVAIVGATGAVGLEIVDVLKRRNFPIDSLTLYASARSANKVIPTGLGKFTVQEFEVGKVRDADVVFLAVSGSFALK